MGVDNMETLWQHRKTGGVYRIVEFCVVEKGLVPAVAYRPQSYEGPVFIRPCEEFFDGRFKQIEGYVKGPKIERVADRNASGEEG